MRQSSLFILLAALAAMPSASLHGAEAAAAPAAGTAPVVGPDEATAPKPIPTYPAANSSQGGPAAFASSGRKISIPGGYIIGADLSSVPAAEDRGTAYYDQGKPMDILEVLKSHGFNYVRLRLFVDPTAIRGYDRLSGQNYCGLEQTIKFAKRIKTAGLGLVIDFEYSDSWADAAHQVKPFAWRNLAFADLVAKVHDYTKDVITQLKDAGATPDIVQLGNEITQGMLLPEGSTKNWDNLAALLKGCIAGVKEVDPKVTIMLDLDKGGNNQVNHHWLDSALARGVEFDILSETCYANTEMQGPVSKQVANFGELVKSYPNLYFVNAEYGGSLRDTDNNQLDNIPPPNGMPPRIVEIKPTWSTDGLDWTKRAANDLMFDLPNEKGLGAFIWEPTADVNHQILFTDVADPTTGKMHPTANQEMYMYDEMAKRYAGRMKKP